MGAPDKDFVALDPGIRDFPHRIHPHKTRKHLWKPVESPAIERLSEDDVLGFSLIY